MSSKVKERELVEADVDTELRAAERRGASEAEIVKVINAYLDKFLETKNGESSLA